MRTLGSREYKLMLRPSKFKGDEARLLETANHLWQDLASIIVPYAIVVSGTEEVAPHKRRQIRFLDTQDRWLNSNNYVLRERVDVEKNERQVTLKFRHPDRYISQDRDMAPADGYKKDMKFEQDIKPPFQAVYSYSSNALVKEDTPLAILQDIEEIFPGLSNAAAEFPKDEKLSEVGNFTAYERTIRGTSFQICKDPETSAVCSVTLWYASEEDDKLLLAEFSFTYEDAKEAYSAKMASRAYGAFIAIQEKLGDWIDPKAKTKTEYVYSRRTAGW
jgi:hypothetical protein